MWRICLPGPEGEFLTNRLASEAKKFLEESAKQSDPFLLYLSFYSVHTPLQAPKRLIEKYQAKAKRLGRTDPKDSFDIGRERQIWPGTKEKRKVRIRQDHPVYAAMVESLDSAVGQVLDRLDELGLKDNTVVIFMSDNGGLSTSEGHPTSNLPLRGGKGWMYEGGIREPVAIRWPGVTPPGTRCQYPGDQYGFLSDYARNRGSESPIGSTYRRGQPGTGAEKSLCEIQSWTTLFPLSPLRKPGRRSRQRDAQKQLQTDPGSGGRGIRTIQSGGRSVGTQQPEPT